jgi:hypothetical protein
MPKYRVDISLDFEVVDNLPNFSIAGNLDDLQRALEMLPDPDTLTALNEDAVVGSINFVRL